MKQGLQQLNGVNRYDEMVEYLKQDNEYWLKNDIWKTDKLVEIKQTHTTHLVRNLTFKDGLPENIKIELKYVILYNFKNRYTDFYDLANRVSPVTNKLEDYLKSSHSNIQSLNEIDNTRFLLYLMNNKKLSEKLSKAYIEKLNVFKKMLNDFFYDVEETEKDIWNCLKIKGVRIAATITCSGYTMNFMEYPTFYRECMKKYFRTIITKKSLRQCFNIHFSMIGFFKIFKELGYKDGFIKNLTREDIEKYIYHLYNKYKGKNATYVNRFLSFPRIFLEYIQMAGYDEAPKKEVSMLIFQDDMPKREKYTDTLKKVKFVPEPILQQLDDSVMELDRPELIPIYILLRETGWRGTDILNLRYNNCLEKIWNGKEEKYNYYLCGEITKTGIPQLKIPIRDTVAEMLEKNINEASKLSNEDNNPNKYLFNIYSGKLKGRPIPKSRLMDSIKRLIKTKDIKNENGELYHFKAHSLRHTRAKEYVEQGMNISIIQQILGHRSLQMTVHYTTVTENKLYEQWKNTEDLNLFKIDENNKKEKINTKDNEDFVRYEFVRKNLDAVKVPFGVCFKPSKLPCKQQINQCLTCASFCTTDENLQEYKEEIARVEEQIKISKKYGRTLWKEKNEEYLKLLKDMVVKIKENHIVHKNGNSREEL